VKFCGIVENPLMLRHLEAMLAGLGFEVVSGRLASRR
jgi:hypothetical protein